MAGSYSASEDAWEDVFALAGGDLSSQSSPKKKKRQKTTSDWSSKNSTTATTTTRPSSNIVAAQATGSDDSDVAFQAYLSQRTSSEVVWPTWMSLGEGFDPRKCDGWVHDKKDDNNEDEDNALTVVRVLDSTCQKCHQTSARHVAYIVKDRTTECPSLDLFCALRNLRCVAVQLIRDDNNSAARSSFKLPSQTMDRLCDEWTQSVTNLLNSHAMISDSLRNACQQVNPMLLHDHIENQSSSSSSSSNSASSMFEAAIQLIMSLDNVYYQLYYSQITQQLPMSTMSSKSNQPELVGVPHPLSYFGLVAVDLNAWEQVLEHLQRALSFSLSDGRHYERLGLECFVSSEESVLHEPTLARLHHVRFLETHILFHKWAAQPSTRQQIWSQQTRAVTDPHETPAPALLMRWRDSCRDFLCHLYSYATMSRDTLDQLCSSDLTYNYSNKWLELGAGTGYLAYLMDQSLSEYRSRDIAIEAFDLHPPTSTISSSPSSSSSGNNEYHGQTPPFTTVMPGSETVLNNRRRGAGWSRTALILCYPPPRSDFAFMALQHFMNGNGKVLVHIGEFKGLTGNAAFERLLHHNYVCVKRLPTLCWGTDASSVTWWLHRSTQTSKARRSSDGDAPLSLLLPCSYCHNVESKRRCRLLRSITYCSKRCFDADTEVRNEALKLVLIDLGSTTHQLNFNSKHHFMEL